MTVRSAVRLGIPDRLQGNDRAARMARHQTDLDRYAADVGPVGEFSLTLYQTGGNEQLQ